MKKTYKNKIFQFLLNHPLGISNFEFSEGQYLYFPSVGGFDSSVVTYKPNPEFKFAFLESSDDFDLFNIASVLYQPVLDFKLVRIDESFESAFNLLKQWIEVDLNDYISDVDEVDLWASYQQRINVQEITTIDYTDATHFTIEEQQGVKLALKQLQLKIVERYVTEDAQREILAGQIKYLTEKVDELTKTDWKGILQNTLISICITLTLDTQKGAELLALVIEVFKFAPGLLHLK